LEEWAETAKGGGELVGVVGGGILELLKEAVDGSANIRGVGGLSLLAVGNVERVESHGRLFSGALVVEGDGFGVIRDALHHFQRHELIERHGGKLLGEAEREGRGSACSRSNSIAVGVELAHFAPDGGEVAIQFFGATGVNLLGEKAEDGVARAVECGIAWAPTGVTVCLAPTVFCRTERVMARETGKLGVFGPDVFLVVALVLRAPNEAVHERAELNRLAGAPVANPNPRSIFDGLAGSAFAGLLPMAGHDGGEGVQLKEEIGMASGDHFVVDELLGGAKVAFEALFGARDDVSRIRHVQLKGLGVLLGGILGGVLTKPTLGRTMAILAAHAFVDGEGTAALLLGGVKSMANETFGRFFGLGAELEDARHAFGNVLREDLVRPTVFVLQNPG